MQTKKCDKCKQIKSINEFYKKKTSKDGFQYWCKSCLKEYKRSKYIPHPTIKEILPEGFKRCSKCKQIKSINKFLD